MQNQIIVTPEMCTDVMPSLDFLKKFGENLTFEWTPILEILCRRDTKLKNLIKHLINIKILEPHSFKNMTFKNIKLNRTDLSDLDFSGSCFIDTKMRGVNLTNSLFKKCVFINTKLQHANLKNTNFAYSTFIKSILHSAKLDATNFDFVSLFGSNLNACDLSKGFFNGTKYDAQSLFAPKFKSKLKDMILVD